MHQTYPTDGGISIGECGLPIYKAAGMSLKHHANDVAQSNFYIPILEEALKAINYDGVHIKGLVGWTYLDNWEWGQFDDCYGVQALNRSTMERTYKRAIFDYSDFMQTHSR
jgi:beta-glucosidase/6-phospho-beta-glucosidase/beta-galactosidase